MPTMQSILDVLLEGAILLFEFTGVFVIIVSGIIGIIGYFHRDHLTRLKLAKGLATGLEFKLGGEILRTVQIRSMNEIIIVGAIIILRMALTFLIHWEINNEEKHELINKKVEE